ncbi:MAG TPA: class II glutamine amidotransferase [Candidatus Nanoarchaeia archaeon]|nr:class II glutamine amidotransferase [Candidatus Nanoarchaeia archaeon]
MCRMLLALGNFDFNLLLDGAILMAMDQNLIHEKNAKKGLGSWQHDSGWGIAYLDPNGSLITQKSSKSILTDESTFQLRYLKTPWALIHVRKATSGNVSLENAHPFHNRNSQEEYVFCHNGTVRDKIFFSSKFITKGNTDTEQIFYSILTDLQTINSLPEAIAFNLRKYQDYTGINFIFSNGKRSFVGCKQNSSPLYYGIKYIKTDQFVLLSSEQLPMFQNYTWRSLNPEEMFEIDTKTKEIIIHKL